MSRIIIIAVFLSTGLILIGGIFFLGGSKPAQNLQKISYSKNAKAAVDSLNFDWGNIPYRGGDAEKTFTIKNTGTDILRITNIKTSCHCTKAQINIEGNLSPYFGMNSNSSWRGEISPNKEAKLKIIFDPSYHGLNGLGPVNRYVSLETNDPQNSRLEFSLTGNVIK